MAAGEYVSVFSQADSEEAELALERTELKTDVKGERKELVRFHKLWPRTLESELRTTTRLSNKHRRSGSKHSYCGNCHDHPS